MITRAKKNGSINEEMAARSIQSGAESAAKQTRWEVQAIKDGHVVDDDLKPKNQHDEPKLPERNIHEKKLEASPEEDGEGGGNDEESKEQSGDENEE